MQASVVANDVSVVGRVGARQQRLRQTFHQELLKVCVGWWWWGGGVASKYAESNIRHLSGRLKMRCVQLVQQNGTITRLF